MATISTHIHYTEESPPTTNAFTNVAQHRITMLPGTSCPGVWGLIPTSQHPFFSLSFFFTGRFPSQAGSLPVRGDVDEWLADVYHFFLWSLKRSCRQEHAGSTGGRRKNNNNNNNNTGLKHHILILHVSFSLHRLLVRPLTGLSETFSVLCSTLHGVWHAKHQDPHSNISLCDVGNHGAWLLTLPWTLSPHCNTSSCIHKLTALADPLDRSPVANTFLKGNVFQPILPILKTIKTIFVDLPVSWIKLE